MAACLTERPTPTCWQRAIENCFASSSCCRMAGLNGADLTARRCTSAHFCRDSPCGAEMANALHAGSTE